MQVVNNPDLVEVELAYIKAKAEKKNGRAYSRFIRRSRVFYVGSSWNLLKRIEEHLGYGAKDTYALQIVHWAGAMNLEIEVICAEYPEGIEKEILQTLEDTLWDTLKPMFGRKGQR